MSSADPVRSRTAHACARQAGMSSGRVALRSCFALVWQFGRPAAPWAFDYPTDWTIPAARWIGQFMKWLLNEAHFRPVHLHRADPLHRGRDRLSLPDRAQPAVDRLPVGAGVAALQMLPPISWIAVIAIVALIGLLCRRARLALIVAACLSVRRCVRPMGQRDGDAGLDPGRRAARRRRRPAARHRGLSLAAGSSGRCTRSST